MTYSYVAVSAAIYISSILLIRSDFKETNHLQQTEPDLEESIKLGEEIYQGYCLACHMSEDRKSVV